MSEFAADKPEDVPDADIDQREIENDDAPKTRSESLCPCKSGNSYYICCMPLHHGKAKARTAEELMRSRYSAYFFRLVDYLVETTHPDSREPGLKKELAKSVHNISWQFLTIVDTSKGGTKDKVGKVEFIAKCFVQGEPHELHERSRFRRYKGAWKYLDGVALGDS
ncbi:SecC motif-containing protein [Verrucomicrobiaceae bacterium N1E253]|uniref:SecC motif-containing protein n=1 Tax=Oceaniferula marina TaxID=2748318 RepID=A0A851GS24_9BACT|nr:YchJ family metal-binding protein [Oceaniferula marina]NWK57580.1 SecC motif-containing protein [Oceaniferula marina]